jgi:hypothetical protein
LWFTNISIYITTGNFPPHFSPKEKKRVVKMSGPYSWIKGYLFYTGPDMVIHKCVRENEMFDILKSCHDEPCGGHFADRRITYKVLHSGYYWPTLFRDVKKYVWGCDSCQRMGCLVPVDEIPF